MPFVSGMIHVYTGNGKGKTTAALGLAVRAAGAGLKVLIIQFMKDYPYSELNILEKLSDQIEVKRFGNDSFVFAKEMPSDADTGAAAEGLGEALTAVREGNYNIIILDEALVAVYFGLFNAADLLNIMDSKLPEVELVLTGRYCPDEIMDRADLVTEMVERRHYYSRGVLSRKGIDS